VQGKKHGHNDVDYQNSPEGTSIWKIFANRIYIARFWVVE